MRKEYTLFNITKIIVGMIAATVASCTTNTVYDSYSHTPLAGWEKNDTLTFNVRPLAEGGTFNETVGLRMTTAFPFTSISLIVEQHIIPHGMPGRILTDTIKCPITDIRGNFLGKGISSYQYEFSLRDINIRKGDSIHVSIRHNMKREILPGVSDIGLKIDKR